LGDVDQWLRIDFVAATRLHREADRPSQFPIHRNGPPGTFVLFAHGLRVSLPTDQIVAADDSRGHVSVSFGGMAFTGVVDGQLTFRREREMRPEEELSPDRSHVMFLDPGWVAEVWEEELLVWTAPAAP
jgi:hypothetical protein